MPKKHDELVRRFATFVVIFFVLGSLIGAVIVSTWIQKPILDLSDGYHSITIVGVDKDTGQGRLATLAIKLVENGSGRIIIEIPPYENEDTQKAAADAMQAAKQETGYNFEQVDVIISFEGIAEVTIAGPSASAAMAVLMAAAANTNENQVPNRVRQGAVVSAAIDNNGMLKPVGEIEKKYEAVKVAGTYSLFVVAQDQPEHLSSSQGVSVERARNLSELANIVLW